MQIPAKKPLMKSLVLKDESKSIRKVVQRIHLSHVMVGYEVSVMFQLNSRLYRRNERRKCYE